MKGNIFLILWVVLDAVGIITTHFSGPAGIALCCLGTLIAVVGGFMTRQDRAGKATLILGTLSFLLAAGFVFLFMGRATPHEGSVTLVAPSAAPVSAQPAAPAHP